MRCVGESGTCHTMESKEGSLALTAKLIQHSLVGVDHCCFSSASELLDHCSSQVLSCFGLKVRAIHLEAVKLKVRQSLLVGWSACGHLPDAPAKAIFNEAAVEVKGSDDERVILS